MSKNILLLRHCRTRFNDLNIISGSDDSCAINHDAQIFIVDDFVKHNDLLVFSSPLMRCVQTVELLKETRGLSFDYSKDARLIERNMGIFEGRERKALFVEYPQLFTNAQFNFASTPPSGETYSAFYDRVHSFYFEHIKSSMARHILICSHNQTLRVLYALINQVTVADIWYSKNFKNGVGECYLFND